MTELHSAPDATPPLQDPEGGAPACVLCFNASEPTGAAGLGADIATIASHYAGRSGKHPELASPVRWLA